MKSLKTKITLMLVVAILATAIGVGSVGILNAGKMVTRDITQIMQLYCGDKAQQINGVLSQIEQSVQTVVDYAQGQLTNVPRFQTDAAYVTQYTSEMEKVLMNAANHTAGAMTAYIRYNPAFTEPTSGLFCTRENAASGFVKVTPTDFSKYDPSDIEHVGWYYVPAENGKPTWMMPYWNQNINVQMISYIIPIVINDVTVGVIGMDIDFSVLTKVVNEVQLFKSGYGFLVDSKANIMYHREYVMHTPLVSIDSALQNLAAKVQQQNDAGLIQYHFEDGQRTAVFKQLNNGMNFVLVAPTKEINEVHRTLFLQMILITVLISALALALTYVVTAKMVKPLLELNVAAKKIADGDMDIAITHQSKDEIGVLADSFRKTASRLQEYISYIKGLAYRDPMTGVKSKTAYLEAVEKLESELRTGQPEFAIIVFDINDLKRVNDQFGHDMGDMQIIAASKMICKVFCHSPIYRIGGDEFLALLSGSDMENYAMLLEQLTVTLAEHNKNVQKNLALIIARGFALYNANTDLSYQNLFKRADSAMYCNKQALKASPPEEDLP